MRMKPETISNTIPAARIQRACDCASRAADEQLGVQPKLTIGPQNDHYEQEADRIADQVVSGAPGVSETSSGITQLQRQPLEEEEEQLQTKREQLQRQPEEEEEEEELLQPKATASRPAAAKAATAAAAAVATGGQPLSRPERAFFESRFSRDLSHVRLHTNTDAAGAASGIGARAYTLRSHIAFASGQYNPGSTEGRRLMAHELTHTLQQGFGKTIRRVPDGLALDDEEGRHDPFAFPRRRDMRDPRGPGQSTLTYAQSRELSRCIEVMGDSEVAAAECANTVLGTPLPEFKSVSGISSPVPFRAAVSSSGSASTRIGRVALTILPDTTSTDPSMQNKAETEIHFPPLTPDTNLVDWNSQGGSVTSFTFNQDLFNLTIQTTYGPGVSASSLSGYGRGTTAADQSVGTTSLGFHEGQHGRDFITFLQDNPYPEFTGRIGQTNAVFSARVTSFSNAVNGYIRRMTRASELATDCPGTSIDTLNASNGTATTICVTPPGNP